MSVASRLGTPPNRFVATHRNFEPLSAVDKTPVTYVAAVAFGMRTPFLNHSYLNGGAPSTTTEKEATDPAVAVWSLGCNPNFTGFLA